MYSAVLLVVAYLSVLTSVLGLPLTPDVRLRNPQASDDLSVPYEDFTKDELDTDDVKVSTDVDADAELPDEDSSNEVPRYKQDKNLKSPDFWDTLMVTAAASTASTSPSPAPVSTTTAPVIIALGDQQFAQVGNVDYQPDPPVFDRRILLKMRKEGLLRRNI